MNGWYYYVLKWVVTFLAWLVGVYDQNLMSCLDTRIPLLLPIFPYLSSSSLLLLIQ